MTKDIDNDLNNITILLLPSLFPFSGLSFDEEVPGTTSRQYRDEVDVGLSRGCSCD